MVRTPDDVLPLDPCSALGHSSKPVPGIPTRDPKAAHGDAFVADLHRLPRELDEDDLTGPGGAMGS